MTASAGLPKDLIIDMATLGTPEAATRFEQTGCLQVSDYLPAEKIRAMADAFPAMRERLFADGHHLSVGMNRRLMPVRVEGPFADPDLFDPAPLSAFLARVLGDNYVLDSFTIVVSAPGATDQHKHQDNKLFGEPLDDFIPCYALHLFVPLVPLGGPMGTTRVWPQSHRHRKIRDDGVNGVEGAQGVEPMLAPGEALIADYRTLHQGTANRSDQQRPLLALGFGRNWYADCRNYEKVPPMLISQEELDRMDPARRARFVRRQSGGSAPL